MPPPGGGEDPWVLDMPPPGGGEVERLLYAAIRSAAFAIRSGDACLNSPSSSPLDPCLFDMPPAGGGEGENPQAGGVLRTTGLQTRRTGKDSLGIPVGGGGWVLRTPAAPYSGTW